MKISIPNVLPVSGFLFFGGMAAVILSKTEKLSQVSIGPTIIFITIVVMLLLVFGLLCYRMKIILLKRDKLTIIRPFRLSLKSINYNEIKYLNWELLVTYRLGDYRKLILTTSTGFKFDVSDFEFINFNSLESTILELTNTSLDLAEKSSVELEQARYNKGLNIIAILIIGSFWLLSLGTSYFSFSMSFKIFGGFLLWRLSITLIQYIKCIRRFNAYMKRERKTHSD